MLGVYLIKINYMLSIVTEHGMRNTENSIDKTIENDTFQKMTKAISQRKINLET